MDKTSKQVQVALQGGLICKTFAECAGWGWGVLLQVTSFLDISLAGNIVSTDN